MNECEPFAEMSWEQSHLEVCFERARVLQQTLRETDNLIEAKNLAIEFLPVLNKQYPYFNQSVYISGNGMFPIIDDEGMLDAESWGTSDGIFGVHRGFVILDVAAEGSTDYRLMQKVLVNESSNTQYATVEIDQRIHCLFDLDSQVIPGIEMEAILSSHELSEVDPQTQVEAIYSYSKSFAQMLRSTEFRRLKHRQQQRVVDDILEGVNKQVSIRDAQFMGEPAYAYAPYFYGTQRGFMALSLREYIVGGSCLGLDSIEAVVLRTKAIRRDNDMADKDAGLCMVVDPDFRTRESLHLSENQVLYIPTHDQEFEVVLYPAD